MATLDSSFPVHRTHRAEADKLADEHANSDAQHNEALNLLHEWLIRSLHLREPLDLAGIHTKSGDG